MQSWCNNLVLRFKTKTHILINYFPFPDCNAMPPLHLDLHRGKNLSLARQLFPIHERMTETQNLEGSTGSKYSSTYRTNVPLSCTYGRFVCFTALFFLGTVVRSSGVKKKLIYDMHSNARVIIVLLSQYTDCLAAS